MSKFTKGKKKQTGLYFKNIITRKVNIQFKDVGGNIEHIINDKKLLEDISNLLNKKGLLYLTAPNLSYSLFFTKEETYGIPTSGVEDGGHIVRGYTFEKLEKILEKNNLFTIHKSYIGGPFSRFLLSISRKFSHKIFKVFYIPLSIVFQKIDHVFFINNVNNLSVAIIAKKIN